MAAAQRSREITFVPCLLSFALGCSSESDGAFAPEHSQTMSPAGGNPAEGDTTPMSSGTGMPAVTGAVGGTSGTSAEAQASDFELSAGGGGGASPSGAAAGGSTPQGMGGMPSETGEEPFAGMELFILFGQSNMAGSAPIEAQDRAEDARVQVLGMYDCPELGRVHNEWAVAAPPLHACFGELGPADYFAKAIAAAWPDSRIGLVPNAVPGVEIDFFRKGMISREDQSYKQLPRNWDSAYDMMIARTRLAMESGRVRGILFHQGESDSGQSAWVGKVAEIVANLRADLGLGEQVPFLPGELPPTACCGGHNVFVNQLPAQVPNSVVISASGLTVHDAYHFDSQSVRVFGQRYASAFLGLVPSP
jgi:hypothetical protein